MSLSAGQITLLRSGEQRSVLGLAVLQPKTVFACQIAECVVGTDMVTEFDYGSVTVGAYGDVIPGQIAFIGSSAGAYDVGICRIRKALTATTIYIGETSDIVFDNGLYVTVIDAFNVRPKHLVVTDDEVFMDVDVSYSDQHENFDPVPVMGGQVVLDVESYPAAVNFPDVADSWVFDSTISARLFSASAGVVTNGTTTNPTLTISSYPVNGYIRVKLQVTAANGKIFSGYRYVFVFDPDHRPITDFVLDSCGAERETGDWFARVILNNESDMDLMRFGGLAVLFSKDYYNGEPGTVGLYPGRENVWLSGWIYERTSINDPEFQPNSYEIRSAAFWMSRMSSFPIGVELSTAAATVWTEAEVLTVDKGLFHYLHWRTTVTQVMDVYLTDDSRYSPVCESAATNIWAQIYDIAYSQILAKPACNHNGKLFVKIPYNLMPNADRAANSEKVMDLVGKDFTRQIETLRRAPQISQVVLSGVATDQFGNGTAVFSLSPGHVPGLIGEVLPMPNLLLADQTQSNILAGLVYASNNNPYDGIPLTLHGNNRAFDIAPVLYGTIADLDEYTGTIIPISINYTYDHKTGKNQVEVVFEGETSETDAIYVNGDIPDGQGGFIDIPGLGKLPPIKPLDLPPLPPMGDPTTPVPIVTTDCGSTVKNFFRLAWGRTFLDGADSSKLISRATFPCKIKNGSYLMIRGNWTGDAANHYHVYALSGATRVATASVTADPRWNRATFSVGSPTVVTGFEIELDAGIGSSVSFTPGSTLSSGSVPVTTTAGVTVSGMTVGRAYGAQNAGGPWYGYPVGDPGYAPLHYMAGKNHNGKTLGTIGDGFAELGTLGMAGLVLDSFYSIVYFIAEATSIDFWTTDPSPEDNTGSLNYMLINATALGRGIILGDSTINDVCSAT